MYKILIVEDDDVISSSICSYLKKWGFDAKCATDFSDVLKEFTDFDPQLVLLDISLPFYNGYHWCEQIRKISKTPIIFISSNSENMSIVMAISMGADDFVSKPFDLSVLKAKVQAVLRRTYDFTCSSDVLEFDGILFNQKASEVTFSSKTVELTKNETQILSLMFENKGNVVRRDVIMEALWKTDSFVGENTLTVNVTRLRKKLEDIGIIDRIVTKKGVGYILK